MRARYLTQDNTGETREERNAAFGSEELTPIIEAPEIGFYLIEWFDDLRSAVIDISDGVPVAIPWSELKAWADATCRVVRPAEYAILARMHAAWRSAIAVEIAEAREREKGRQ